MIASGLSGMVETIDRAGIGLRQAHLAEIADTHPPVGFLEVHAENYMSGSPAIAAIRSLRRDYPFSLHGVGLSLGGVDVPNPRHLGKLKALVDMIEPAFVSEHLSWSSRGGRHFNDLLPLPYTKESLAVVVRNVVRAQEALGRPLLIENPSAYLRFAHSTIPEYEFLAALAAATDCRLLCDINNVYVNACNFGFDPSDYLAALPSEAISEFHLAGHHRAELDGQTLLIDDHGAPVADAVWSLYAFALGRFGPVPTLIEWDSHIPPLATLLAEARHADRVSDAVRFVETAHAAA